MDNLNLSEIKGMKFINFLEQNAKNVKIKIKDNKIIEAKRIRHHMSHFDIQVPTQTKLHIYRTEIQLEILGLEGLYEETYKNHKDYENKNSRTATLKQLFSILSY